MDDVRGVPPIAACPGCRVTLPGPPNDRWDARSMASGACHMLYGEVLGYELEHVMELGRWHQLLVDTYGAQHADERTPAIGVAFALIGLHLALERGWSGLEVRDAHQALANAYRDWPPFGRPRGSTAITVQDLAGAGAPSEYVEILDRWARDVWDLWRPEHRRVDALVRERLLAR